MKQIIYSSYWGDIFNDETIEATKEELKLELEREKINDEEVYERIYQDNTTELEYIYEVLGELIKTKNTLLVKGIETTWRGSGDGGKIINTIGELLKLFDHCDNLRISTNKKHLYIEGSHHDGGLHVEVKELTSRGEKYLEKNGDLMSDRDLHSKLWDSSNYTRLFNFKWY